jgi:hypothetical protein
MKGVILPAACWPNIHYMYRLLHADEVLIEQHDHYRKQTYRSRYLILSANGILPLTIPVIHTGKRQSTGEVRIAYDSRWQAVHWGALTSAYRSSPYFEFFEDEIRPFYSEKTELLLDFNLRNLETILKLLKIKKQTRLTTSYEDRPESYEDLRALADPLQTPAGDPVAAHLLTKEYYQTFSYKFPFAANLSMLDLLFNEGLKSLDYLGAGDR